MRLFRYILAVIFLLPCMSANATAPSNLSSSSTFKHGAPFIVTGANFGAKTTAAPLRDDDFSSGVDGAVIPDTAEGWYTETGDVYYSKDAVRWAGQQSIKQDFTTTYSRYFGLSNGRFYGSIPNTGEMYVSGWFKYSQSGGGLSRNVKILNMASLPSSGLAWQTRVDTYPATNKAHLYAHTNSSDCSQGDVVVNVQDYSPIDDVLQTDNNWHRIESYLRVGSNGYRDVWVDGVKWGEVSGNFMADGCGIDELFIGHYFARDYLTYSTARNDAMDCEGWVEGAVVKSSADNKYYTCESDHTWDSGSLVQPALPIATRYWDQIYVDTTRARVELCNASTKAASDHCEIQKPTSWSTSAITFEAYSGTFTAGSKAYLYVVNGSGEVNTTGLEITLGTAVADTTPPTVSSTSPADGAVNVPPNTTVSVYFSEGMNTSYKALTISPNTAGTVTASGSVMTIPNSGQAYSATYTVTVPTTVRDLAGLQLATAKTFSYTTAAASGTCTTDASLCLTEETCLTEHPTYYWNPTGAPPCSAVEGDVCSMTNWYLCTYEQVVAMQADGDAIWFYDGFPRTVPRPATIGGENVITQNNLAAPWIDYLPFGWSSYLSATASPTGAILEHGQLYWPYAFTPGKTYYVIVNILPNDLVGQVHVSGSVEEMQTYYSTSGTKIFEVTAPEGLSDTSLYFDNTAGEKATIQGPALYEKSAVTHSVSVGPGTPASSKNSGTSVRVH